MGGSLVRIVLRGAGDLATGVALRLYRAGFRRMLLLEAAAPLAVRRQVAFSEAVTHGRQMVEGVTAARVASHEEAPAVWQRGEIPVLVDPYGVSLTVFMPDILIDAVMAKRNLGTVITAAPLVIALGPGFEAGVDAHRVVETMRGHTLGRVISKGQAAANTGVPAPVGGYTVERLLRAPAAGLFRTSRDIGDMVQAGDLVGHVENQPVTAAITGVLRGVLRDATQVTAGLKLGDIDPRAEASACCQVSDKALAIGGGVLEAVMERLNATSAATTGKENPWPSANP